MTVTSASPALDELPQHCDVLVLGAGPSGSACARWLALQGWRVVLADAQRFPRDKTCGDGLVPDTHAALRRLGVLEQVQALARPAAAARCVGPSGRHVDVEGELAVLPRRVLDALLCQAAVSAGALHVAPARFVRPLRSPGGRVCGAVLADGSSQRQIEARWVVLATGAASGPIKAANMCERDGPSAMGLRAYVRHPGMSEAIGGMRFVWHARLKGGYGWIFAGPDGLHNIGVGLLSGRSGERAGKPEHNLRHMFETFVAVDPVAAQLMREGTQEGGLKGAPLRCDLDGARWAAPGLLLVGDAVGATYAFSGEGIGKALETGMAAADALIAHAPRGDGDAQDEAVIAAYAASLQALKPRFEMYRQAASFNRHPWLLSLVIWRARHNEALRAKLGDILNERRLPGRLLSWRGLRNLLRP